MNCQKKPPEYVLEILKAHSIKFCDLYYYARPRIFSSTGGPHGGRGGQAITIYTVEAWSCDDGSPVLLVCDGMYILSEKIFDYVPALPLVCDWKPIPGWPACQQKGMIELL